MKDVEDRGADQARFHSILCAFCHREIEGTPVERNGFLYHSEEHARADQERAVRR